MEISEEYKLAGQPWEKQEDEQLIKEYNIDKLTVIELCKIHKRMPGGIISRLRHLNLIIMRTHARGYSEYEQSDLYKEICKNKMLSKEKRKEKKETHININEEKLLVASIDTKKQTFISTVFVVPKDKETNTPMFISDETPDIVASSNNLESIKNKENLRFQRRQMPSDVIQLKSDVNEIKVKVNKILELMNALYEFESQ